jgi:hypothetical protein
VFTPDANDTAHLGSISACNAENTILTMNGNDASIPSGSKEVYVGGEPPEAPGLSPLCVLEADGLRGYGSSILSGSRVARSGIRRGEKA